MMAKKHEQAMAQLTEIADNAMALETAGLMADIVVRAFRDQIAALMTDNPSMQNHAIIIGLIATTRAFLAHAYTSDDEFRSACNIWAGQARGTGSRQDILGAGLDYR